MGQSWLVKSPIESPTKMPICLKRKITNEVFLPAMTYGSETWSLTKKQRKRLAVTQRNMERSMLGITRKDKRNEWIREKQG